MNENNTFRDRAAILLVVLAAAGAACIPWNRAPAAPPTAAAVDTVVDARIAFLTDFYKMYVLHAHSGEPPTPFYSTAAEALIAENDALCRTLSRSDDICGYGADIDVFLSTQETAPDLSFARLQFKAALVDDSTVDVAFNVWPEYGADSARQLRYKLVPEGAAWRVDDVLIGENGVYSQTSSMRHEILDENQRVRADAADAAQVAGWIFIHLSQQDMLERIARFMYFPVQICGRTGRCRAVDGRGPQLASALSIMHRAYYKKDGDDTIDLAPLFVRARLPPPVEGATVRVGAVQLSFRDKAWWISKIDLAALGQPITVR